MVMSPPPPAPQPNPDRLLQLIFAYAPPLMVETALRFGVFDLLDRGPATLEQAVKSTGASERGLRAVLNALVGLELLAKDGQGRYSLTPESSAFLVTSRPGFLGGMFRHTVGEMLPRWSRLHEVVRTGHPATAVNEEGTGAAFFGKLVEDLFRMNYPAAHALAES